MKTIRGVMCAAAAACMLVPPAPAQADVSAPVAGVGCPTELADTMTLLPDEVTYVACQDSGSGYTWTMVQTPFPPNDRWLSYGPPITLHGEGMRNPNVSSGQWEATPQDPDSACRATQTTVVEAGVLAAPQVSEGEPGMPMTLQMLPKLFYLELAGNCLWVKQ